MITLDIDNYRVPYRTIIGIDILKLIFHFRKRRIDIFIRRSCQKGWHIKIYDIKNNYFLRRILGDDKKRIKIDKEREQKGLPINILFSLKKDLKDGSIKRAGEWELWEKVL